MSRNMFDDSRNPELQRALRDALPPPPIDAVDWTALQQRITAAAQPHFQPAPAVQTVWQPLAGWSRLGIPLSAAAALVMVLIGTGVLTAPATEPTARDDGYVTIEEELFNGLGAAGQSLLAELDGDAFVDVALFYDGEDW
jgi:hypothetical protein